MLGEAGAFLALVAAEHERLPGGPADCALAVGPLEQHSLCCQSVDVGRPAELVPVASEDAGLQVVGNQEQDVSYGLRITKTT